MVHFFKGIRLRVSILSAENSKLLLNVKILLPVLSNFKRMASKLGREYLILEEKSFYIKYYHLEVCNFVKFFWYQFTELKFYPLWNQFWEFKNIKIWQAMVKLWSSYGQEKLLSKFLLALKKCVFFCFRSVNFQYFYIM